MLTITLMLIHSEHHLLFTRRSLFLPLDFSSPRPLYDLVSSPPAVSTAVFTTTEPIASEIPAKDRKQSFPLHTLFAFFFPSPKLLFWPLILGPGADDFNFHCQDGIVPGSSPDLLSTFSR